MTTIESRPPFAYGAVYYRRTNPPEAQWERDYTTAREDGFTSFRHWFMWTAIEPARGVYEWDEYDRQLDLAAANGMTTVIAEHVAIAPEWLFEQFSHARYERADGSLIDSSMQVSSSIGGTPGLCLDNDDVRALAGDFLTALASRYVDHPGTGGYDVWNECNIDPDTCYCGATQEKFRDWLRAKYGDDVAALRSAWGRFYSGWEEVSGPRELGLYGQSMDWLQYRIDRAHELMRWRVATIRAVDSVHPITAHGLAGTLGFGIVRGIDDWASAAEVDSYGFTFVASRRGDEPWKLPLAVELVRSASGGKDFWHAEAQAGPLWWQPQVIGRPLDDGRISTPEDIRYANLVSFAGGVTGLFYPRWRPLLDGPLFQAFGAYGMDGSRNDRTAQVAELAGWSTAPENQDALRAAAVMSGISIIYEPASQAFAYVSQHSTKNYEHAITGAWRAMFDLGVTADFRKVDQLDGVRVAYLPFPQLLPARSSALLTDWVGAGGTLISDGAPAWFSDHAHASETQPGSGLDALFGVREAGIEFTPDILDSLTFRLDDVEAFGGEVRQWFTPTAGTAAGWYSDDSVAVVDNAYGAGRTRLVGTNPGTGYFRHEDAGSLEFFRRTLDWAGVHSVVSVSDSRLTARLRIGADGTYLWLLNPMREDVSATVELASHLAAAPELSVRWGASGAVQRTASGSLSISVPARDAVVIRLATPGAN